MLSKSPKEEHKKSQRKCKQCLGEVPEGAKKCMHCGSNLPMELSTASAATITIFMVIFVMWAVVSCSKSFDEAAKAPGDPEITASVCAQTKVQSMLKSPKSADFPWVIPAALQEDGTYAVLSYVDAQNSFGAIIRTNFLCTVKVLDAKTYQCETQCTLN